MVSSSASLFKSMTVKSYLVRIMDTLLKIHNKLEFLHPVHGFADKVGAFGSLKPQNLEPKFHYKKSHIKLCKSFCVKASSSALLELCLKKLKSF
ncbi:UNVERIFIED_CONTAM: Lycopene beta cyclase, chloroplastic [Sesamum calycinum]|uniref:Lycopene beta cyclase, chloroplastic n=1 Tax=Sesamum calycinum TaxID=2727403 RepID=A0AAW2RTI6_9LAMI